jgi:hypothetical protein
VDGLRIPSGTLVGLPSETMAWIYNKKGREKRCLKETNNIHDTELKKIH